MKGSTFGPFHQFRIDTDTLPNGQTQATGFDAGQPGTSAAVPFVIVVRGDKEMAYRECLEQIKSSPEWVEACRLESA